jgi:HD-like signal output (HDOD) protein
MSAVQDKRRSVLVAAEVPYSRRLIQQQLKSPNWQVRAAGSAAEALAAIAAGVPDVLVIDLVNPPSAGEQLVLQVRVAGCMVPAMLLCSTIDRDMLRRLNNLRPVAFLPKPPNFEHLRELLPLALSGDPNLLRRSLELASGRGRAGEALAGKAGSLDAGSEPVDAHRLAMMFGQLPLLPHVLAQILTVGDSEQGNAAALAEVISGDPRLSGQLLRVVNSAYFGFARRISTIPEATVILGSDAIRKLAVGASVSDFFGGKSSLLDRARLWRHSLATAVAGRLVAEYRALKTAQEAFAAGLLHDFGRLALERHFAGPYGKVVERAMASGELMTEAEEALLHFNHAWVSGWLAQKWNLPPILADAMAWHHSPEQASDVAREVAAAVHVGDVLCNGTGYTGIEGVTPTTEVGDYALGVLDLSENDLASLAPRVGQQAADLEQQLAAVLNMD